VCACLLGSLETAIRVPTINTFTSIGTTSHGIVVLTLALVSIWYLMTEFSSILAEPRPHEQCSGRGSFSTLLLDVLVELTWGGMDSFTFSKGTTQ